MGVLKIFIFEKIATCNILLTEYDKIMSNIFLQFNRINLTYVKIVKLSEENGCGYIQMEGSQISTLVQIFWYQP